MKTFSQLIEALAGTLTLGGRTTQRQTRAPKAEVKSSKAIDRDHPTRYNTTIRGSSMLDHEAHHDVVDFHNTTGAPIYGLKEKVHGKVFKYTSHFMDRVNNVGENRNRGVSGDYIKKVKSAVAAHVAAGNEPRTHGRYIKRVFVGKNGYKFPVRIHNGEVHMQSLLAPHMKTDTEETHHIYMNEAREYEEYEEILLDF